MESMYWLIAFIILLVVEIMTLSLTTIWFAGGSIVGFIASLLGASLELQIALFLVVSIVLLIFIRSAATKLINKNTVKTNYQGLIGKKAKVTEMIDNQKGMGAAIINGQIWTARTDDDDVIITEGTTVKIERIDGVKLIVKEEETYE